MNMRITLTWTRIATFASIVAMAGVVMVGSARASFGIAAFDQQITSDAAGDPFTQAGGHPYAIVTNVYLNSHPDPEYFEAQKPDADAKDIFVDLPPGEFGNPAGIAQCTMAQLTGAGGASITALTQTECPVTSVVGIIKLRLEFIIGIRSITVPVFNMVPPSDLPAQFGFSIGGVPVLLGGDVRNGSDFGVTVSSTYIPIASPLAGFTITFWGDPVDKSHDSQRCNAGPFGFGDWFETGEPTVCTGEPGTLYGPNADPVQPRAFLTIPVSCPPPGVGLKTVARVDPWDAPGNFVEATLFSHLPPGYPLAPSEWGAQRGTTRCDLVPFKPSVRVEPTNHQADTPTGLNIDFRLPQEGLLNPEGISTSDVQKTVVALPAGIAVSPSAASGLQGCSPGQIGLGSASPVACPDGSKLGTVEIVSPLLEEPLKGYIYLAKQNENPFGSLMAIYLTVEGHGVVLKLAGRVDRDPVTGQVITTVENSPQLPFEELKVDFKGGPRSPLVNPHTCGTYTTDAVLTPWSGNAPVSVASSFDITSGPDGGACPNPSQFAPGFSIGTTNNQAGAFSPLSLTMTRADGDQQLGGITMHTPTGLLGTLSTVSLCPEPQASQGTCGESSQIGSITAASGAGPNPFYVTGGKLYITGPYKGAPFGLSAVVPAKAGPFDLGTVVVRGSISVDPQTAALTVTTDPLPTILDGIPLDLRLVNVSVDRPGFIFNPTDCDPMSITGALTGGQGLVEPVSSSFQVTNCAVLGFKPSFKVSTAGKTSRTNGASLSVKLTYPNGSMGTQSNLAKVKVDLPKQLPSRLTTLQKACPDSVFNANPAACPPASRVGQATATTPIIPEALSGPAFFVSHGGAKFPELIIALSGYGVTVYLHGETFINPKTNITSSTFRQVPDVPIGSFELKLPEGSNSALAAIGNLCKSTLKMPTLFIAQDGAEIHQSTPITVTGCSKHKTKKTIRHKKKNEMATREKAPTDRPAPVGSSPAQPG